MNVSHRAIREYKISEIKRILVAEIKAAKKYRDVQRKVISGREHYTPEVLLLVKETISRITFYIRLWNDLLQKPDNIHLRNFQNRYHAIIVEA